MLFRSDYKDHKVLMKDGQEIPTRTFLWVSGVKAQPITGIDGDHLGRGFRIVVDEFNRIPGMDGLFAIGDQCLQTADPAYPGDRKSTRLNSSHVSISYAVFCLKKKTKHKGLHKNL